MKSQGTLFFIHHPYHIFALKGLWFFQYQMAEFNFVSFHSNLSWFFVVVISHHLRVSSKTHIFFFNANMCTQFYKRLCLILAIFSFFFLTREVRRWFKPISDCIAIFALLYNNNVTQWTKKNRYTYRMRLLFAVSVCQRAPPIHRTQKSAFVTILFARKTFLCKLKNICYFSTNRGRELKCNQQKQSHSNTSYLENDCFSYELVFFPLQ